MRRVPYEPGVSPSALTISSVEVIRGDKSGEPHDVVRVWNRGAYAGDLRVKAGDGNSLAMWLMPDSKIEGT